MKELAFFKQELKAVNEILVGFKLKGKESRLRMKLVRAINNHLEEFEADEKQLFEEYVIKGEDGTPVEISREVDGKSISTYDFEDEPKFLEELKVLHTEKVILDQKDLKESLYVILTAIDEFDGELSGQEAIAHDLLYEKIADSLA